MEWAGHQVGMGFRRLTLRQGSILTSKGVAQGGLAAPAGSHDGRQPARSGMTTDPVEDPLGRPTTLFGRDGAAQIGP